MRSLLAWMVLAASVSFSSGCVIPIWSANPDIRVKEMIYQSENYRQIPEIWERIWFLDMPDLETPYRVHGGVI
jgi:hypothetical protein